MDLKAKITKVLRSARFPQFKRGMQKIGFNVSVYDGWSQRLQFAYVHPMSAGRPSHEELDACSRQYEGALRAWGFKVTYNAARRGPHFRGDPTPCDQRHESASAWLHVKAPAAKRRKA